MKDLIARISVIAKNLTGLQHALQNVNALVQLGVQTAFAHGAWWVDSVVLEPETLRIAGWAKPPNPFSGKSTLSVNGVPFDTVEMGLPRPGVAKALSLPPEEANMGYKASIDRNKIGLETDQFCFRFENGYTGRPFDENQAFWYIDVQAPVPDEQNRKRIGGPDLSSYLIQGATAYAKLAHVLRTMFNKDFDDFQHVLDWGCGCGRVSRFLATRNSCKLTGLDIDRDNIQWCSANLPNATFKTIDLHPPTPIESNYFEVLFGISVFTHLSENGQFRWLAELRRIARPGAILLMTVNAETHWFRTTHWNSVGRTVQWQGAGYLDMGVNPSLEGYVSEPSGYRKAKHTTGYVLREWSRYFDVVDILPGYIGNQDLVVMLRRDPEKEDTKSSGTTGAKSLDRSQLRAGVTGPAVRDSLEQNHISRGASQLCREAPDDMASLPEQLRQIRDHLEQQNRRAEELSMQLRLKQEELALCRQNLKRITESRSWKITAPLRWAKRLAGTPLKSVP
mgnify:CR=1 FL=1